MAQRIAKKLLLIGWDAADWKVINPLLDAGLMPALEKLINEGVMGNIATLHPPISPILWNSIATGKLPQKHGIFGFTEPLPDGSGICPVTSSSRQCKAIWNILTQAGLRTHVVGWFASHPAELISGVCISNQFHASPPQGLDEPWPIPPQSVHPAGLAEKLAEYRVHPAEMEGDHLQPFIPRGAEINQNSAEERHPLVVLSKRLAECASVHAEATWVMENEPWDFTAIYYNAIDLAGHYFMPFHPPRMEGIGERLFELYKDVMNGVYRFHDMMLERLLQLAGDDCTVILLSDHGFYSDHLRPAVGSSQFQDPAAWHRSHGILCMRGPELLPDERIYGSSLVDIVPTILTFFGLPVADDMDGKALIQAFKTPPKIERIPSWEKVPGECGMHPQDLHQDPVAAQEALRQLVDLGYLQPPGEDVQKTIQQTLDDLQCNRSISLLNYGNPLEAAKLLKELWESHPEETSYGISLAQAYFKAGQLSDVRAVLEKLLQKNPSLPFAELMMGSLLLAEGQTEAALERLHRAEQLSPRLPQLHIRLGSAYLRARQWGKAGHAFKKALEIEGDSAEGCHGMSISLMRQNRLDEAAEMSLRAVGLQHYFPSAHFQLGAVLARLNMPERAALAFEHGLAMRPGDMIAHRYLARLYYRLGDLKKCHEHQEAVSKFRAAAQKSETVQQN